MFLLALVRSPTLVERQVEPAASRPNNPNEDDGHQNNN